MRNITRLLLIVVVLFSAIAGATDPSSRSGYGAVLYDTGTTFRVWAPNAASVGVKGDFNYWSSWSLASEGNGWWSADIEGAGEGDEYRYFINDSFTKIDPRACDVTSSVGNGVIVSHDFSWSDFTPPAWNEMVIYEMHIGSYNDTAGGSPGTWQSCIDKLDHLVDLGINAIEILPVGEFAGDFSMGYNPANIFAPESAYGSFNDMRRFVNKCHKKGIAVIVDVVYNHFGSGDLEHSLWQFDGYCASADTGGIYFFENEYQSTPWGDRPNFTTGEVRSFIRDNAMYWLSELNCDGLRMDGTAYVRLMDDYVTEVPEGWSLMQWINNEIDAICPEKISIAEDMRDNEWITKTTGAGGAGFDSQWDAGFHHTILYAMTASDDSYRDMYSISDIITDLYNGWDTQRVIYTESHDEVGSSSGKRRVPEDIWPGNADSYYSKKRSTLGAGIMMTSPGIPMLFMGQEFLEDGAWHDDNPLDWTKDTTFAGIKQLYKDLISLRLNKLGTTNGLMAGNTNVFHVNNTDKVIAYHRWWYGGPGDDVVIIANFSATGYTSYNIGMPRSGRWRVRFNSDWIGYDSGFDDWYVYDTNAVSGSKDGLDYNANVGIAPYSMIILSQGTTPDIDETGGVDLDDFAVFSRNWLDSCDSWYSCEGADFDMSGMVDSSDLYDFVSEWLE